ncbi:MAG: asparagine synthase (glutamine-hydrolyzing) [Acidobacteriota bacterium]
MCGICGCFAPEGGGVGAETAARAVAAMTARLARRGPDDQGAWVDDEARVRLGFRRLAVLDLSPTGHQPMVSASGRSALVFNGEIYNFRALRQELEATGVTFRSTGDTEVLIEALEAWGPDAIERLDGMFAFAWWQIDRRRLLLARDAAGIKPLHLHEPGGGRLVFASQLDALLDGPWGPPGAIRRDVLAMYLRLVHVPPPHGLLDGTRQLTPGHWLRIDADGRPEERAFRTFPRQVDPRTIGVEPDEEALAATLDATVEQQLVADVPVGVFLSGGIDSPLVAALARRHVGSPLRAYTLANPGWEQDESAVAAEHARRLGLDARVLTLTEDDVLAGVDMVRDALTEPFADVSIVPTLLLSEFARSEVTVVLSGDGGDELFYGYERPVSLLRDGALFRWPLPVRRGLYYAGRLGIGPRRNDVVVHPSPGAYYACVNTRFDDATLARLAPELGPPVRFEAYESESFGGDPRALAAYSRYAEWQGQLQRCLKKVDMASMHHGLEIRVPLLGRAVVDAALAFDPLTVLRDADGRFTDRKRVLRRQLERHVPASSIPRRKLGFAVPMARWLRGPLRGVLRETLLDTPLVPEGLFDRRAVEAWVGEHLDGRRDHKWSLWGLMTLQWWARRHGFGSGPGKGSSSGVRP